MGRIQDKIGKDTIFTVAPDDKSIISWRIGKRILYHYPSIDDFCKTHRLARRTVYNVLYNKNYTMKVLLSIVKALNGTVEVKFKDY